MLNRNRPTCSVLARALAMLVGTATKLRIETDDEVLEYERKPSPAVTTKVFKPQ